MIEIKPSYAEAWNNKGYTLHDLSRYDDAIECYNKSLDMNSNDAHAWYSRACSKIKKGDIEGSLVDLKKAIEIDKNSIESAKEDKDFESIRNDERFKALITK